MNKKTWIAFLAVATCLITGLAVYLLYNSRENEHRLRLIKESELSRKVAELGEKETELQTLIKQKADLETQFNAKLATLESTVKDYDDNSKAMNAKMESVLRENDQLKRDLEDRDRRITELARKVRSLESDKTSLLESLNKGATGEAGKAAPESAPAADALTYDAAKSPDSVKLGKIVVQKASGHAARVEYVDKLYGFIVINAGSKEGLKPQSVVNVVRGDRLVAKAVVQKVRPDASAAVLIAEWSKDDVKIGDFVSRIS